MNAGGGFLRAASWLPGEPGRTKGRTNAVGRRGGRRALIYAAVVAVFVYLQSRNAIVGAPNANHASPFAPSNATSAARNVIAYSLYGSDAQFVGGAAPNAALAAELFPGWEVRFYHDASVPGETLEVLGAMPHVRLHDMTDSPVSNPRAWRFLVALDPEVTGAWILRDTDSRLSRRERSAVEEWLRSNRTFHVMHDHPHHCSHDVQAGMWGGKGTVPEMDCVLRRCAFEHRPVHKYDDQLLLMEFVMPAIRESVMHHDSFCCGRLERLAVPSRPFPTAREAGGDHVGSRYLPGRGTPETFAPLHDSCERGR